MLTTAQKECLEILSKDFLRQAARDDRDFTIYDCTKYLRTQLKFNVDHEEVKELLQPILDGSIDGIMFDRNFSKLYNAWSYTPVTDDAAFGDEENDEDAEVVVVPSALKTLASTIVNVPTVPVVGITDASDAEKERLIKEYVEKKVARDLKNYGYQRPATLFHLMGEGVRNVQDSLRATHKVRVSSEFIRNVISKL